MERGSAAFYFYGTIPAQATPFFGASVLALFHTRRSIEMVQDNCPVWVGLEAVR